MRLFPDKHPSTLLSAFMDMRVHSLFKIHYSHLISHMCGAHVCQRNLASVSGIKTVLGAN